MLPLWKNTAKIVIYIMAIFDRCRACLFIGVSSQVKLPAIDGPRRLVGVALAL